MPLKAVLFDMDGVIVDTEPLHKKAYFTVFEELGLNVDSDLYNSFTGNSTQKVAERLISLFNLPTSWQEIAKRKRKHFKHYFDNDPTFDLIPGVLSLIKHYHQNNIKLIIASSAHRNTIGWVLEKFELSPYFSDFISGAELKESKPAPEIFLLAAERVNEPVENCMVIEDSTNGILAASRAGIFCAAYRSEHSKGQDYEKSNLLVNDYSELVLEKIAKHF